MTDHDVEYEPQEADTTDYTAEVRPENTRKISVVFARKLTDGNYGGFEARAYVEASVPADATEAQIAQELGAIFMPAAAAVFEQLGIAYHLDPDTQTLREDLKPVTEAQAAQRLSGGNTEQQPQGGGNGGSSIRVMNPSEQDGPLPQWLIDEATKAGVTAVFDNRKTATGNQPKFKEAVARGGQGHGKDGAPKAFWAPK